MIDKNNLNKIISDEFPDLKNTKFSVNNSQIQSYTDGTLLPFLIYQNTTDSHSRLIELYLQENSSSIHLLPFYIAVGFYRKAINNALNAKKFKNEKFLLDKKKVVYQGSICSIVGINFFSKTLQLRSGIKEVEVPFYESFRLSWNGYQNSIDIKDKIESFERITDVSDNNLFSLPIPKEYKDHEGIVLFSNVSKFEVLLRNLKVSGNDLRAHLNIQKTVFNLNEEEIRLKHISRPKTIAQPPTLLISSIDTLMAFEDIILSGDGKLDHLNTVIIDDFDLLIKSWERSGELEEKLSSLKEVYFDKLGKGLKDIYLICRNRNFDIHSVLIKNDITSMAWMIKPQERINLDEIAFKQIISVKRISGIKEEATQEKLESLIFNWKELGKRNFCNGQVLNIIRKLYTIREKWSSFFYPESFNPLIEGFVHMLNEFRDIWFSNKQDDGIIESTIDFISDDMNNDLSGFNNLIEEVRFLFREPSISKVTIITNNRDSDDHAYFRSILCSRNIKGDVLFVGVKEFINNKIPAIDPNEAIIYLVWSKDLVNNIVANLLSTKQIFLLNYRGYQFIKNYTKKVSHDLTSISTTNEKYALLNLSPFNNNEGVLSQIEIEFIEDWVDEPKNETSTSISEIEDYVREIVWSNSTTTSNSLLESASYTVFFDDGSHMDFLENKSVFYYDESDDMENEAFQKCVKDLEFGDLIIVPKNRTEIKKLLDEALSHNEDFAKSVIYDNEWRDKITEFVKIKRWDLSFFRKKLAENGFPISVDFTIKNWIDGETLQPHKFKQLLMTLVKMEILTDSQKENYFLENKNLKRIKLKFVRTALQKLIFSLKGINHVWDEDLFDSDLLNLFLDHIEIKPVVLVVEK